MFLKCLSLVVTISASLSLFANPYKVPPLPEPVANNAVASVEVGDDIYLVSFMGLGPGKGYRDVHNKVWAHKVGDKTWKAMTPVPSSLPLKGRLASVAVTVGQHIYLFGGYTVAEDHSEISSPDNFRFDVVSDRYTQIAPMPVAVDDTAAVVYQDRYIYLISGWHNDGNVNLVQVYDTQGDSWAQASPFVGQAVFGQAAGIVENTIVVCDGVKVVPRKEKRRTFGAETACYLGAIDSANPLKVDWRILKHPTGTARYRMAAVGLPDTKEVLFWGGSDNPYNYDGVGYNGQPSSPSNLLWRFALDSGKWNLDNKSVATMDHRGLLKVGDRLFVVGGMGADQQVLDSVLDVVGVK